MATQPDDALIGQTINQVASILGYTNCGASSWLNKHGYRVSHGKVIKSELPGESERRIQERITAAPPSSPCFRCGAARGCEHRSARGA